MKYSRSQLVFGAVSLAIFPASFVFVWFLIDNTRWCLSDMCVDWKMHNMGPTLKNSLIFFYAFLTATLSVSEASRRIPQLKRVLMQPISKFSSVTVAEVVWFVLALVVAAGCAAMGFMLMWNNMLSKLKPGAKINYSFSTANYLFNASGDALAVLMGFVMIPVSKNSFLATFFNLPYTAMARVHIWIGRALWWLVVVHFVDGCMKYALNNRDVLNLIRVPVTAKWGGHDYAGPLGLTAAISLLIVTLTSLDFFRRKFFNVFYYTHFLVFVFVLFAYLHASNTIYYILPGLLMYTIDGFMRLHSRFSPRDKVSNVIFEECGYITLTFATKKAAATRPGQFMRVCFPEVSAYEFHPWSVVNASADSVTFLFATTSDNMKEWTWKLQALLTERVAAGTVGSLEVCLQGPFGSEIGFLSAVGEVGKKKPDMYVFYVGGTGVSASIQGIEKILACERARVMLVWSARVIGMEHLSHVKKLIAKGKETSANLVVELYETHGGSTAISSQPFETITATKLNSEDSSQNGSQKRVSGFNLDNDAELQGTHGYTAAISVESFGISTTSKLACEKALVETDLAGYQVHHQRSNLLELLRQHVSEFALDIATVDIGIFVCGSGGLTKHALESVSTFKKENKNVKMDLVVESFAL
ncbi:hypothetical protein HDU99_000598 [Rhizoclosmatium hyalinum]|nr:hypothetical protein HDU99_000598 [Rhizoclosmatium hyalinum]